MICEDFEAVRRAVEGTRWDFDPGGFEGIFSLRDTRYKIKTYRALLTDEYCDIRDFRRSFDYRLEAWKDAELRQDGKLKKNNKLKKHLKNRLDDWFEILRLELNYRKEIAKAEGFDPKFTLDQIREYKRLGERYGFEFKERMFGDDFIFYYQNSYSVAPDIHYRIPIMCYSLDEFRTDYNYYYDNFDKERELKAALIEKYGTDDIESPEAEELREQVNNLSTKCLFFGLSITDDIFNHMDMSYEEYLKMVKDEEKEGEEEE